MDQHDRRRQSHVDRASAEGNASTGLGGRISRDAILSLSREFLTLATRNKLGSSEGDKLLRKIEQLPSREDRVEIINATSDVGLPGHGVLSIHRRGLHQKLFDRLLSLGLNLSATFPIEIASTGQRSNFILNATIYHLAAIRGDIQLLKRLPKIPALINSQTQDGETPLVAAVKYGADPVVAARVMKVLAELGADFALRDSSNRHAFHYAFNHFHYSAPRVLGTILQSWRAQKILPINKFEARSGLACALISELPRVGRRTIRNLKSLIDQAPDSIPHKGAPISGILHRLEALLPRAASPSSSSTSVGDGWEAQAKMAQLEVALARLGQFSVSLGRTVMVHIVESQLPTSTHPILATAYMRGVGASTLQMILNLGAALHTQFDRIGHGAVDVIGGTLLHHAINEGKAGICQILIREHPELAGTVDGNGNSPIHTHLQECIVNRKVLGADIGLIKGLVDAGCAVDQVNADDLRPVDLAIELGDLSALSILDRYGAKKPRRDSMETFEVRSPKRGSIKVDYSGLLKTALRWRQRIILFEDDQIATKILADTVGVLRQTKSVYSAYLTLVAGADFINPSRSFRRSPQAGTSLLRLAPSLLFHQRPQNLRGLWEAIDWMSDRHPSIQKLRHHFNEAEMLLLLNHPKQRVFDPRELDPLTRAITATRRVADDGFMELPHSGVWNLARIGLYTHGFHLSLKHDCQPALSYQRGRGWIKTGPSLLEKRLGMVRLPTRKTDATFGAGFLMMASPEETPQARLLRRSLTGVERNPQASANLATHQWYKLSPDTMMEFRRGYTLVSNPEFGTLLIRNSSLIFGRNSLLYPAYWMEDGYRSGYSYIDLTEFSRYDIEQRMKHVLDLSVISSTSATESIYHLLRQLDVVRDLNRRLKFETDSRVAFELDGESGNYALSSTGGYRAPGFASIVQFFRHMTHNIQREVEEQGRASREVPDLAFTMPWFPPWVTYRFSGEGGRMQSRLKVNKDVLAVLKAYAEGSFTRETVELDDYYGVGRFFQEAGFNNNAELVILSPRD